MLIFNYMNRFYYRIDLDKIHIWALLFNGLSYLGNIPYDNKSLAIDVINNEFIELGYKVETLIFIRLS